MDGNEKAAQPIDFNSAKVTSTYKNISRQIIDTNDVVSRTIRRLQTTLDANTIIELFYRELSDLMEPGQLRYQSPNDDVLSIGDNSGAHNCQFNLAIEDTRLGKLTVCRRKRYSDEEISIVELMASTLVFPLKNALMYQDALNKALTDELTGMGNKRALAASVHREAERATRKNHDLSAIMLDIDHFKAINDTYGHSVGDSILTQFSQLIKDNFRQSDLCFRYGGEEFLLLLDDANLEQTQHTAERLRAIIENHTFNVPGKTLNLTTSLGCSMFMKGEGLKSFIDRADKALYSAKRLGRNQVNSTPVENAENPLTTET